MPELPDLTVYLDALGRVAVGRRLERIRIASPSLLRTVEPALTEAQGKTVREVRRIGKRLVLGIEADLFLVLHLMIAGRLHWRPASAKLTAKMGLGPSTSPPARCS